jgi:hypothetical protein
MTIDADSSADEDDYFCTFAATGEQPSFQPIYILRQQRPSTTNSVYCLCEGCAAVCHASTDRGDISDNDDNDKGDCSNQEWAEFVGVGYSYCDCDKILQEQAAANETHNPPRSCQLIVKSRTCVQQWNIIPGRIKSRIVEMNPKGSCSSPLSSAPEPSLDAAASNAAYIRDAYRVTVHDPLSCSEGTSLEPAIWCRSLELQAHELVKHTKETHWISVPPVADVNDTAHSDAPPPWCGLEQFARSIFSRHVKHYGLSNNEHPEDNPPPQGAEWWVQVKPVDNTHNDAIDLHYDKDELLAEKFRLGSFPSLSTVTYLTDDIQDCNSKESTSRFSPTVVFSRTYDQPEEAEIGEMYLSYPRNGNHIVFDGRLLHGAPAHEALKRSPCQDREQAPESRTPERLPRWRVTLLVNIWVGHRPAAVKPLPSHIRDAILKAGISERDNVNQVSLSFDELETPVLSMVISTSDEAMCVDLPFLGKGTTWDSPPVDDDADSDSETGQTVVSIYPPPQITTDTAVVRFGHGQKGRLQTKVLSG